MLQQILRAPALKAVLIQVLAFPLMLGLVYLLARAGIGMTLLSVALLRCSCSAHAKASTELTVRLGRFRDIRCRWSASV